jgi:hypothetical protein
MKSELMLTVAMGMLLSACANLPSSTAGSDNPSLFAVADDKECQSNGHAPGTQGYADCRTQLGLQHKAGVLQ